MVKLIVLVFAGVLLLRFLGDISRVLLGFALVLLLAMILTPPVSWLERHRVPRSFGAPLITLLFLSAFVLFGLWLIPPLLEQITAFITSLPAYWASMQQWINDFTTQYPRAQSLLMANERLVNSAIVRAEAILLQAGQFTLTIATGLAGLALVLVMTLFTLARPRPLLNGLFAMIPEPSRAPVAEALHTTAQQMRVYAWSSLLVGLVNGTVAWIGLTLLGVQPALLLASLVFVGEFFPYVGPIAAAFPAVILALTISPWTALWTALFYIGVQQLEAAVLSPLILSKQMKFHPLSVAFALLSLGELFGILGALLAVPALATVKAFYESLVLKPRQLEVQELEQYADIVVESHRPEPTGEE